VSENDDGFGWFVGGMCLLVALFIGSLVYADNNTKRLRGECVSQMTERLYSAPEILTVCGPK